MKLKINCNYPAVGHFGGTYNFKELACYICTVVRHRSKVLQNSTPIPPGDLEIELEIRSYVEIF